MGFGLRGLTQLRACVLPAVVLHLKFVSGKPQKKALTFQTGSGKTPLPSHLQRLVFSLISDWFAKHIGVKPPHGERPFLSILSQCWNIPFLGGSDGYEYVDDSSMEPIC